MVHTVVSSYHDRPGYVNAMADLVAKELAKFTLEQRREGVQVSRTVANEEPDLASEKQKQKLWHTLVRFRLHSNESGATQTSWLPVRCM